MEEFIKNNFGYIIGTLLFSIEFIIWHILKRNFKSSKHKNIAPEQYNNSKNK